MFPSNAKRNFSKKIYVDNKRLAPLSLLFFRLSLKKYVHLKRTFRVQKFGVLNAPVERITTLRGCVNFPHGPVHDYPVERY